MALSLTRRPGPISTERGYSTNRESSLDSEMKKKVVDYVLTIVHREPEIRMAKKYKESGREYSDEIVYYTDGRPEFSTAKGRRSPEPVTRWQGNKLVRTVSARLRDNPSVFARKVPSGPQTSPPLEVVTTEEWTLSTDGKTLTRTIATSGVVMSRVKYVFVRG